MAEHRINKVGWELGENRIEIRKVVVGILLEEEAGTGKGDLTSRYTYIVEELEDGREVYLRRPAWLKKGFDFYHKCQRHKF